jgi:hypothetical protein
VNKITIDAAKESPLEHERINCNGHTKANDQAYQMENDQNSMKLERKNHGQSYHQLL